jgi:hypothetical protein
MNFLRNTVTAGLGLLLALPSAHAQNRDDLVDTIGANPEWTIVSAPVDYAAEDLERLGDPDQDLMIDYGIRGATTFDLMREGPDAEDTVAITLYEMRDSSAAFGLFAMKRDPSMADFGPVVAGTESYRQNRRLHVWQANYLIIAAGPADDARDAALRLSEEIFGVSRKAPVSLFLPRRDLVADSEKYVLSAELFEEVTGIDPTLLGFESSAEAAIANYETPDGTTAQLAMLLYPTQHLASLHMDEWSGGGDGPLPNRRSGPLVGIATRASDTDLAADILDAVQYESQVTWNVPPPDPLTLPQMILTIFAWIGIAMVFTVIVGLGYGGVRIYLKTRYPERFLGASPNAELVQLRLDQEVTSKRLTE